MKIGIFHIPNKEIVLKDQILALENQVSTMQATIIALSKWKGTFTSLSALETTIPVGEAGWSADVDIEGSDAARYIWDSTDNKWVIQKGISTTETAISIKTKYESNADTNAFTDTEKTKLSTISENADSTIRTFENATTQNDISEESTFVFVQLIENVNTILKTTWSSLKSKLKTYFDIIYQSKNLKFSNVNVNTWISDSTYSTFIYKSEIECTGVTSNDIAEVFFAQEQCVSNNYAQVCETGIDKVTIYSKVNSTITIPTILIHKS